VVGNLGFQDSKTPKFTMRKILLLLLLLLYNKGLTPYLFATNNPQFNPISNPKEVTKPPLLLQYTPMFPFPSISLGQKW
jgi:hypothetical protein